MRINLREDNRAIQAAQDLAELFRNVKLASGDTYLYFDSLTDKDDLAAEAEDIAAYYDLPFEVTDAYVHFGESTKSNKKDKTLKENAFSDILISVADELRSLSNGDDQLALAADSIEIGEIEDGFDIANLQAENASDNGDDDFADAIWDALAPLRQVSESTKNKKADKMTESEKRAYKAGYKAGLKKIKECGDDAECYDDNIEYDELDADDYDSASYAGDYYDDPYEGYDDYDIYDGLDESTKKALRSIKKALDEEMFRDKEEWILEVKDENGKWQHVGASKDGKASLESDSQPLAFKSKNKALYSGYADQLAKQGYSEKNGNLRATNSNE